jgi:hypothetical protein
VKRGIISAVLSGLVCPGAGQLYNRQYIKGGLIILASLSLVGAAAYRTWEEMMRLALAVEPGELFLNLAPMAHRIAETNKPFYDKIALLFLALWVYGVIDAYIAGYKQTPKNIM